MFIMQKNRRYNQVYADIWKCQIVEYIQYGPILTYSQYYVYLQNTQDYKEPLANCFAPVMRPQIYQKRSHLVKEMAKFNNWRFRRAQLGVYNTDL